MTSTNPFNPNEDSSILLEFTKNFSKPFDSDQLFNIESLKDNTSLQINENSCFIPNSEKSLNIEEFLSKEAYEMKINSAVRSSQKSFVNLNKLEAHLQNYMASDLSVDFGKKHIDFNDFERSFDQKMEDLQNKNDFHLNNNYFDDLIDSRVQKALKNPPTNSIYNNLSPHNNDFADIAINSFQNVPQNSIYHIPIYQSKPFSTITNLKNHVPHHNKPLNPYPNEKHNNVTKNNYNNPQTFPLENDEENYSYKSSLRNSLFPPSDPPPSSSQPPKSLPKNPLNRLKTNFLKESPLPSSNPSPLPTSNPRRRELEDMSPFSEYSNRSALLLKYDKCDELRGRLEKERSFYDGRKLQKFDKCDELRGRVEKERSFYLEREATQIQDGRKDGGRERNDHSGFIRKTNELEREEQQGRGSNGKDVSSFICIQKYLDKFGLSQRNKDPETIFNTRIKIQSRFSGDEEGLEKDKDCYKNKEETSMVDREVPFSFNNEWDQEGEESRRRRKHIGAFNDGLAVEERRESYGERQFCGGSQIKNDFLAANENEESYGERQVKDDALGKGGFCGVRKIKDDFLTVYEYGERQAKEERYNLEKFINDLVEVYTQDMESNWFTNERENVLTETENEEAEQKDFMRKKSKSNYELRERARNKPEDLKILKKKEGLPLSSSHVSPPSSLSSPPLSSSYVPPPHSSSQIPPPSYSILSPPKKNCDNKENCNLKKVECVQINICRKNGEFSDLFRKGGKSEGTSYKEIKNKNVKRN